MIRKLVVAYTTKLSDPSLLPTPDELDPPGNMSRADSIDKWRKERQQEYEDWQKNGADPENLPGAWAACLRQPYTATFGQLAIWDVNADDPDQMFTRSAKDVSRSLSLSAAGWLARRFGDLREIWPNTTHPYRRVPRAIFIGFDPKLFLRILGVDCSLPQHDSKSTGEDQPKLGSLPLSLWYGNSDHRDIEQAVKPSDCKMLSWRTVLQARGLLHHIDRDGWEGPGKNAGLDMAVASNLAGQLNMLEALTGEEQYAKDRTKSEMDNIGREPEPTAEG